jgi:tetratricopeptide (TPR) repeat protein
MATDPAGRYGSARALAEEIKHWLADEPVAAYAEPWNQRLARWTRRHRAWVLAAAAAVVVVAMVATAAALAVNRSYRHEQHARAQAVQAYEREQEARRRSESDFGTARGAINRLYALASRELAGLPRSEAMRERLARQVVVAYDELLKSRGDNQEIRREAILADRELAHACRLLGQIEPASAAFDRAIGRLRRLLAERSADRDARNLLALTLGELGLHQRFRGQVREAETTLAEARDLVDQLRDQSSDDLRLMRTAAYAVENQAAVQLYVGRYEDARQSFEQALALWKALVANPRVDPLIDPLHEIGCQLRIGVARRWLGDSHGAREAYDLALHLAEQRAAKFRGNSDTLVEFSGVRDALGDLLLETEPSKSASLFTESIKDLRLVVNNHLLIPSYRRELAIAHNGLGAARLAAGTLELAGASCDEAQKILVALLKERDVPDYHYSLARTLANQARIARARRQPDQARRLFNRAIEQHALNLAVEPRGALDQRYQQRCRDELQALDNPLPSSPGPGPAMQRPGTPP